MDADYADFERLFLSLSICVISAYFYGSARSNGVIRVSVAYCMLHDVFAQSCNMQHATSFRLRHVHENNHAKCLLSCLKPKRGINSNRIIKFQLWP